MAAYWLTYVPTDESERGWPLSDLRDLITRIDSDPNAPGSTEWWRIANGGARVGERVYVFKQGTKLRPRGLIGVGAIVSSPEMRCTQTDPKLHLRAEIRFEKLVDPTTDFLLPYEVVQEIVPQRLINAQRSGTFLPEEIAAELERRLIEKFGAS